MVGKILRRADGDAAAHTILQMTGGGQVIGDEVQTFIDQSIAGGEVTAYDASGAPVQIQLRWAKTDSATTGTADTPGNVSALCTSGRGNAGSVSS